MEINTETRIHELLQAYPELEKFLIDYNQHFSVLGNPAVRSTVGKMATLKMAAGMAGISSEKFVGDIRDFINQRTQSNSPEVETMGKEKIEILKGLICDLHEGRDFNEIKANFNKLISDIEPGEIVKMEEQLIREGFSAQEIQKLCDVHVGVFKDSLEKNEEIEIPIGHPLHTYQMENDALTVVVNTIGKLIQEIALKPDHETIQNYKDDMQSTLEKLSEVDKHYQRKEHQLFPYLEKRGITAPPQVMWGVHDEIRGHLKEVLIALENENIEQLLEHTPKLTRGVIEMIYKEKNILFPMAMEALTEDDWRILKANETDIGFTLLESAPKWPTEQFKKSVDPIGLGDSKGKFTLETGKLNLRQINLLLKHLPIDITFVDKNDEVAYFSAGKPRIFHRGPEIIGRKVQMCHPPSSIDTVNRILDSFKSGAKDVAEFWIHANNQFIHIRYFAVRDEEGEYRGCLEVTQEIGEIQKLSGDRRLLDWDAEN